VWALLGLPAHCSLLAPSEKLNAQLDATVRAPVAQPYEPKHLERPAPRETLAPPRAAVAPVTLPDQVVLHALDLGRAAIVRCFRKANGRDPTVSSYKVRVKLELDAAGGVTKATSDAEDPELAACLVRVGSRLPFPAPGQAAMVEFPLFYRPEP
jgi:hypothetical protein